MKRDQAIGNLLIVGLVVLLVIGLWQTSRDRASGRIGVARPAERVMGTTCTLAAVVRHANRGEAERALQQAEVLLRRREAELSNWLEDSEISRLNRQPVGEPITLSASTMEVLHAARGAYEITDGAFDITCRPLIDLWRKAASDQQWPDEAAIEQAREQSHWGLFELQDSTAVRLAESACLDLGGIAKGYAVDDAAAVLRTAGSLGGLVDVGGDLLCFGLPVDAERWTVDVRNPFESGAFCTLSIDGGAVCTSGNYARFEEIRGRRLSQIMDPRSGRPTEGVPSVTVLAPNALTADIWATALSVLGEAGLSRLPTGVEALLIVGSRERHRAICTPGLEPMLWGPARSRVDIWQKVP